MGCFQLSESRSRKSRKFGRSSLTRPLDRIPLIRVARPLPPHPEDDVHSGVRAVVGRGAVRAGVESDACICACATAALSALFLSQRLEKTLSDSFLPRRKRRRGKEGNCRRGAEDPFREALRGGGKAELVGLTALFHQHGHRLRIVPTPRRPCLHTAVDELVAHLLREAEPHRAVLAGVGDPRPAGAFGTNRPALADLSARLFLTSLDNKRRPDSSVA